MILTTGFRVGIVHRAEQHVLWHKVSVAIILNELKIFSLSSSELINTNLGVEDLDGQGYLVKMQLNLHHPSCLKVLLPPTSILKPKEAGKMSIF